MWQLCCIQTQAKNTFQLDCIKRKNEELLDILYFCLGYSINDRNIPFQSVLLQILRVNERLQAATHRANSHERRQPAGVPEKIFDKK